MPINLIIILIFQIGANNQREKGNVDTIFDKPIYNLLRREMINVDGVFVVLMFFM